MDDISFLKRSDLDIKGAKKKLDEREKQLLKAEKAFDKQMKKDKKELENNKVNKI